MFSEIPPPAPARQHQGGACYARFQAHVPISSASSVMGIQFWRQGKPWWRQPPRCHVCVHVGIALKTLSTLGGLVRWRAARRNRANRYGTSGNGTGLAAAAAAVAHRNAGLGTMPGPLLPHRLPRPGSNPPDPRAPSRCGCPPTRHRPLPPGAGGWGEMSPAYRRQDHALAGRVGRRSVMGNTFRKWAQAFYAFRALLSGFGRRWACPVRPTKRRKSITLTFYVNVNCGHTAPESSGNRS